MRAYTTASLRDCWLAEMLAVAFAVGLVGCVLVVLAMIALIAIWLGLQIWHGIVAVAHLL